jgi:DNA polymerase III alpha subunit
MGFPILPPDVNASRWEYTVQREAGGAGLRVGLGQLKEARQDLMQAIVDERERGGPYTGFRDFCARAPCRFQDIRVLVRSGALDSVSDGCTRPQLFFRWLNMQKEEALGFLPPAPPVIGDYTARVKLIDEVQTLGIVVTRHPLVLFRPRIDRIAARYGLPPLVSSRDIPDCRGRRVWTAGILVTGKEVATKKREPMIFVSFEDELAIFETVLFPDAFNRFYPLLDDGWAFLIYGRVEDDLGAVAISVERLVMISRRTGEPAAVAAPERPPVFMWSHFHDGIAAATSLRGGES